MPKYRKLHVKTVESLDINDMPDDFTRLTWVLLPLALCREGRGMDNIAWLKAKIYPLRLDVTSKMITEAFDWYEQNRMIIRYEVDGRKYFYIPTWHTYQGDTSKEADTPYPSPSLQTNSIPNPEQVESRLNHTASASASAYESTCESTCESESDRPNVFAVYEHEIGSLTPMIADALKDAENEYPQGWIEAAIAESAANNARSWKYTEAILKRWKVDGFKVDNRRKNGSTPDEPASYAAIRAFMEENPDDN